MTLGSGPGPNCIVSSFDIFVTYTPAVESDEPPERMSKTIRQCESSVKSATFVLMGPGK